MRSIKPEYWKKRCVYDKLFNRKENVLQKADILIAWYTEIIANLPKDFRADKKVRFDVASGEFETINEDNEEVVDD